MIINLDALYSHNAEFTFVINKINAPQLGGKNVLILVRVVTFKSLCGTPGLQVKELEFHLELNLFFCF